jgi:GMP synthase-like glutamine amidotransferase
MKPVAIFRHTAIEGAAYFATFLEAHSIPFQLIAIDRGDPVPASAAAFSGLCFMGGPMSVNDPLPWIAEECALIRDAAARNIPVIGHCLGGQLISKAFGGSVTRNAVKEIGWGKARVENNETARHWLGDERSSATDLHTVFQWHGETFSIPPSATRLLSNDYCTNQMFALGPHLGMQCHVEMTPAMIAKWCESWPDEVAGITPLPEPVQTPEQMLADTPENLAAMRLLADRLYSVWIDGLPRG